MYGYTEWECGSFLSSFPFFFIKYVGMEVYEVFYSLSQVSTFQAGLLVCSRVDGSYRKRKVAVHRHDHEAGPEVDKGRTRVLTVDAGEPGRQWHHRARLLQAMCSLETDPSIVARNQPSNKVMRVS